MNPPILPIAPINATVSIQPLTVLAPNRDATQADTPLATLAPGTTVEGFVINRDTKNNPILRTPLGDFVVQSTVFIKTGSTVVLRVDPSQTSRAKIITVDGFTPQDYAAKNIHGLTHDTIVRPQMQQTARGNVNPTPEGQPTTTDSENTPPPVLKAVVLQPTPAAPAPPQSPGTAPSPRAPLLPPALTAQLTPGAPLVLTVIDVRLPPSPVALATLTESSRLHTLLPGLPATALAQPAPSGTSPLPTGVPTAPGTSTIQAPPVAPAPTSGNAPPPAVTQPTGTASPALRDATRPPAPPPAPAAVFTSSAPPITTTPSARPAIPAPPLPVLPISSTLTAQAFATTEFSPAPPTRTDIQQTQTPISAGPQSPAIKPSAPVATNAPSLTSPSAPATKPLPHPNISAALSAYGITAPAARPEALPHTIASPVAAAAPVLPATNPAPAAPSPAATQYQPPIGNPSASPPVRAEVIGHDADGANILHTPLASLKLYTTQPLPTGTVLMVRVDLDHEPPMDAPIAFTKLEPLRDITNYARDWHTLAATLGVLQEASPVTAERLIQQIPTLNHQFTSSMLFFISALKGGALREWLGDRTIKQMEAVAPAMLNGLIQDMERIQHAFVHSPLTDWSSTILPFMFGAELHQARLYVRNEEQGGKAAGSKGDNGQRFIVECALSQLGELQLDGFIRATTPAKHFDLVVRGAGPLPADITQGIRQVFTATLEATRLSGQISFQYGAQHFVRPLTSLASPESGESAQAILA